MTELEYKPQLHVKQMMKQGIYPDDWNEMLTQWE